MNSRNKKKKIIKLATSTIASLHHNCHTNIKIQAYNIKCYEKQIEE